MKTRLGLAVVASTLFVPGVAHATTQEETDPALQAWRKKVTDAKALSDATQQRDTLLALAREALTSKEVRLSGTAHADQVHPGDNQPAPIVNFDPRLNDKTTYASGGGAGRRLETSPAYYYLAKGTPYVVLGPRSLDPRSPVFTRMQAEHELFHAKHHVGDPRPLTDRELETWTHVFVTYFQDVYPFKQKWSPLVSNYEEADPGEQKAALDKLVAYYRAPPAAAGDAAAQTNVRAAFDDWLARRRKDAETSASKLVADLGKALAAPARPATPGD